jgi:glutamyl-Q tRNA(Asp) synthetase
MPSTACPPVRTRFAPSPTGHLHLGHALAAKIARDLAKIQGNGLFFLRHEDIDGPRVREEYVGRIEDDMRWLGLLWDGEPLRQSSRTAAYESALATLRDRDLVYPCFCTRREIQEELASAASAPHGPSHGNYPGTCKALDAMERADKIASGMPHAWRLDSEKAASLTGALEFNDLRFGRIAVDQKLLGDVVLARKDIGTAYHLAVVVDDAFQEITHVTRGEDLLESTHVHRLLQSILGLPEPLYLHHRLMLDETGKRLAKRAESSSLSRLRETGATPSEILRLLDFPE